jgi:TolA-binding protein
LSWSPNGQEYGYAEDGILWLADISGNREKLGEGSVSPDWSYDGTWMAFCDREGRVWIAETGKPPDWIVEQDHCQVSWSPAQSILAYATFPAHDFTDQAAGTAFLYDPLNGTTREVARGVSEVDWSPDGKLVSIQRITWMGASNYGFSISAVNPETGQELLIEEFSAEMYGNHDWIEQVDGYIVGKYKFQADLSSTEQLADILFDATRDGSSLLVGSGNEQAMQVSCRNMETNSDTPVANMSLMNLPGVHASFSPDGTTILVSNDEIDRTTDWLARCGDEVFLQIKTLALPTQQYFSPDSSLLVMEQTYVTGEESSRITIQDLENGQTKEIPAGLQTGSAWFRMPEAPVVPTSAAAVEISPAASPVATGAGSPVPTQAGTTSNRIALFSILLWAGALAAIVILMLSLWRRPSVPRAQAKAAVVETPVEENVVPLPLTESETSQEEVEKAFQSGVDQVRAGKASEGMADLTKVIRAQPGNEAAWFWLGIASARQKDYRSAERCFLQAKRHGHPEADKALDWLKKQG